MSNDREEVLKAYLNCTALSELSDMTEEALRKVNFSKKSEDPLVEALKKLIFSYCQSDAQVTVIKNVNLVIERNVRDL